MSVLRVVSLTQESMEAESTRERGPSLHLDPWDLGNMIFLVYREAS